MFHHRIVGEIKNNQSQNRRHNISLSAFVMLETNKLRRWRGLNIQKPWTKSLLRYVYEKRLLTDPFSFTPTPATIGNYVVQTEPLAFQTIQAAFVTEIRILSGQ